MFQKSPLFIKILIVCSSTLTSFLLSIWLNGYVKSACFLFIDQVIPFLLTWFHIFAAFMFFQTFKYFRLNQSLYSQKFFETPLFFSFLGVPIFRKILVKSFFRYLNQRVYIKERSRAEYARFIEETRQSETSHIFSGMYTLGFQIYYVYENEWEVCIWLGIFNLIFNLYPILLQRMNRFQFLVKLDKFS